MKPYYEHDGITIFCGDCREVLPSQDCEERFEEDMAVVTDPPYGLGKRLSGGSWGADCGGFAWDSETPNNLTQIVTLGHNAVVWGGNYFTLPPRRCWLVWFKPDAVPTMGDVELAWTTLDKPAQYLRYPLAAQRETGDRVYHPTVKPRVVMEWSINLTGSPALVLDPFMGSGTTLVAAKNLGHRAIGIEIEERYCEIAARRLDQTVLDLRA